MRTCACGCGASMEGRRPNARYHSDACRAYASDVRRGKTAAKPQNRSIRMPSALPWCLLALIAGVHLSIVT